MGIMELQVAKWGSSLAVRLPAECTRATGLREGEFVAVEVTPLGQITRSGLLTRRLSRPHAPAARGHAVGRSGGGGHARRGSVLMIDLDTSAAVPLFVPEPSSAVIDAWYEACADTLVSSDWIVTEFASALAIKARAGALAAEDAHAIWREFDAFCGSGLRADGVGPAPDVGGFCGSCSRVSSMPAWISPRVTAAMRKSPSGTDCSHATAPPCGFGRRSSETTWASSRYRGMRRFGRTPA
jgi:hypothetical protein